MSGDRFGQYAGGMLLAFIGWKLEMLVNLLYYIGQSSTNKSLTQNINNAEAEKPHLVSYLLG